MQFTARKRRGTPTVIIVSLIDVLIVVLIFLMVTTTFKQQPALKLVLPKSNQARTGGATENQLIVTVTKSGLLYFKTVPVTLDKLQQRLQEAFAENPNVTLSIRGDTDAPWGQMFKVSDAANAAHIKVVNAAVDSAIKP
jgi:biopolymer transport protein ExbD